MKKLQWLLLASVGLLGLGTSQLLLNMSQPQAADTSLTLPVRAAFYYPWFPQSWNQQGLNPFTKYNPSLGFYDSANRTVISSQVDQMTRAGIQAGISSWWGSTDPTDARFGDLLSTTDALNSNFKWAPYYELEGTADPTQAQITADLQYIHDKYTGDPAYLKVGGKPVLFVYNANDTTCSIVDKWKAANTMGFYLSLKVFSGYKTCANQPDTWHQYAPAVAQDRQAGYAFSISAGFWKANEATPRLVRDPVRWAQNVAAMKASGDPWQIIATFNEWGEGSAIEPATQWQSASGQGIYLDALLANGPVTPPPTTSGSTSVQQTTTAPPPTTTSQPPPTTTSQPPPTTTTTTTPPPADPVIAAAGDIACTPGSAVTTSNCRQGQTANLIVSMNPAAVLTLGDNQYESNTLTEYNGSFAASWGKFKAKIHPGIGNHEYLTTNASGYFSYFGSAAGSAAQPYYSYDVGTWHILSLNDECSHVPGGCGQENTWIQQDLAAHPATCTLFYWHEPRFSSGQHGSATQSGTMWNTLAAAHADVSLNGHNHDYERFQPAGVTPTGNAAPTLDPNGIREFVVGTGGKNHYSFGTVGPLAGEVVRDSTTFGVLKLTLHPGSYDWQFVRDSAGSFADSGTGTCH